MYKEYRRLNFYDARALAIKEDWFTIAYEGEYEKYLNFCDNCKNFTINKMLKVAEMVYKNSDMPIARDYEHDEVIENILFILANAMTSTFEKVEN